MYRHPEMSGLESRESIEDPVAVAVNVFCFVSTTFSLLFFFFASTFERALREMGGGRCRLPRKNERRTTRNERATEKGFKQQIDLMSSSIKPGTKTWL